MNTHGNSTPTVLSATGMMQKTKHKSAQPPNLNESTSNSQSAVLRTCHTAQKIPCLQKHAIFTTFVITLVFSVVITDGELPPEGKDYKHMISFIWNTTDSKLLCICTYLYIYIQTHTHTHILWKWMRSTVQEIQNVNFVSFQPFLFLK